MKRKSIICLVVSALLVMSGCVMEEEIRVTGVSFQQGVLTLRVGQEGALYVVVTPSNAAHPEVNWESNNESVAIVSPGARQDIPGTGVVFTGRVNAYGEGSARITVTTIDGRKVAYATVSVWTTTNAKPPTVTVEWLDLYATYEQGDEATPLVVSATSPDGGSLSYQWYSKKGEDIFSTPGAGDAIPGAAGAMDMSMVNNILTGTASYRPPTTVVGTTRYCVIVTSYNSSLDGNQTATTQSDYIDVYVNPSSKIIDAETPTITAEPKDVVCQQDAKVTLSVEVADIKDGGELSYQWEAKNSHSYLW